tara:strand:+ start:4135 stop:4338 length:204 start_codon:yes stop_codon:yes gene_type:complete
MKLKVGQRVKVKTFGPTEPIIYTILEIMDGWLKLKHPEIGGYFGTKIESVTEVYFGEWGEGGWYPFN